MKFVTSLTLFFGLIISIGVSANTFSGNIKSYPILKRIVGRNDSLKTWQNSAKIQYAHDLPFDVKAEVMYEIFATTEKPFPHSNIIPNYRVKDFKPYLHNEMPSTDYKTTLSHNLNRFNVSTAFSLGDVTIGRQPIAFGSAKSINPTDVLAPFSITTIDKEERAGVDAAVFKIPINSLSLIEAGYVGGENFESEKSAIYIRPKFNYEQFDISFTSMRFREINMLGFDLQRPIRDAGFWFESSYIDQTNKRLPDFYRLTTGLDYKFQNSLYLAGEYHFNGAALKNGSLYPLDFIYLRNQNYFIGTSSYELTPLTIASLQSYFSLKDDSNLSSLKVEYNIIENAYIAFGSYLGFGNASRSEFGRYGKIYYSSFRYYF